MIKRIAITQFKTHYRQLINNVKNKHSSFIITKYGIPIAQLIPVEEEAIDLFGALKGTVKIKGDIVLSLNEHWDAE